MQQGRFTLRVARYVAKRLRRAKLDEVEDRRSSQGLRIELPLILRSALVGLMAGEQSLRGIELLTEALSGPMRKQLGLTGRMPDTTMRDALVRLHPYEVRKILWAVVEDAHQRKALEPEGFPFGVLAMDGRDTAVDCWDHQYAQQNTHEKNCLSYGLVRTISCALVSARAKPCIDAVPLPAETNEMGIFPNAFESQVRRFGHLFRLVTYDSGAASKHNAKLVVDLGKDYLFQINDERRHLYKRLEECFAVDEKERARSETVKSKQEGKSIIRRLFVIKAEKGFTDWPHLRTALRVNSQTVVNGVVVHEENRYYLSSLAHTGLSYDQWLALVRHHWGVENNCHNVWDKFFEEDESPIIEGDPRGTVVMMVLRRVAYTLLALFKSVTQRSDDKRRMPWREFFGRVRDVFTSATADQLAGLQATDQAVSATS
jgi:hypothetical protein